VGRYVAAFAALLVLHFNLANFPPGLVPFRTLIDRAMLSVFVRYPGLFVTLLFSPLALVAWRSFGLRLVFVALSLIMQVLYLINVVVVLSGGEVFNF
jgi:hypothetical protein